MKKRLLSAFLMLCMLLGTIPVVTYAETIVPIEDNEITVIEKFTDPDTTGEDMLNSLMSAITSSVPEGFDKDTTTPYGTKQEEAFTLLENDEIFTYISSNGSISEVSLTDDLAETDFRYTSNGTSYSSSYIKGNSANVAGNLSALRFAQGVAFDPSGCGRRNYVAIMGYTKDASKDKNGNDTGSVYLYIINADKKALVCRHTLRSADVRLRKVMDQLTVVDSPNFFSITAGDYDNDGKETLMVYTGCVTSTSDTGLYEVTYSDGSCTQTVLGTGTGDDGDSLLNSYYMSNTDSIMASTELRNQLTVDLTTGDYNNDGVDDLLVLSGLNYPTSCYNACVPQLRIRGKWGKNDSRIGILGKYSIGGYESDNKKYCSITSGSTSIGDLNGDGKSEVVVAGFYTEVDNLNKHGVKDHHIGYVVLDASDTNGALSVKKLSSKNVSGVSQGDSLRENEYAIQQFSVECVALGGIGTKEYVFLNGYLYQLGSSKDLTLIDSKTNYNMTSYRENILHEAVTSYDKKDIDEVFVYSTSVGNVFSTIDGREAILVTVGYKTHTNDNKESKDKEGSYYFSKMIVYMDKNTVQFDYFKEFNPDSNNGRGKSPTCVSGSGADGISCLMVAVDYGDDSVIAKYSQKAYTYTDPAPVAFLQAAPYYKEFEAGNSSTTYSYSETYSYSSGSTTEYAYDIGFTSEIETSVMKTSFEAGCSYDVSEEFTKTMDTTYTITFEANDKNQVILRQTVVYYYLYDVMTGVDSSGNPIWTEDSYVISVPQYPVLTSLTVEQYNALANAYNDEVTKLSNASDPNVDGTHKMPTITEAQMKKYYLYNEGNPFGYAPSTSSYSNGYDMYQENGASVWMSLSRAGGTQSQACTVSLTTEQSKTTSEGMYVNMSVMVGAEAFGVGAFGGISAGYSRVSGRTYSTAHMTEKETGGTVQNLGSDVPESYGLMWKLIGWSESSFLSGVPCIGYAASQVRGSTQPVDDLAAKYSYEDGGKVTLTWKSPEIDEGRHEISGFRVYQNGRYIGYVANLGEGTAHSYVVDVSKSTAQQAVYTVVSAHAQSSLYSIPSNEAVCLFVFSAKETIAQIDQKVAELEAKITNLNTVSPEELSAAVSALTDAYTQADKVLKDYMDQLSENWDDNLSAEIGTLKAAIKNADDALQNAVDTVQKNLDQAIGDMDQAISDLKQAVTAGDESNSAALAQAISALTNAYQAADSLLQSGIDALSTHTDTSFAELQTSMDEANESLKKSIQLVQSNLDSAVKQLKDAITSGDESNSAALAKTISDLTNAYQAADSLLQSGMDALSTHTDTSFAELQTSMDEANESLKKSIQLVQSNLDSAIKQLKDAIASGDEESANALSAALTALTEAYQAADDLLILENDDLKDKLEALQAEFSAFKAETESALQALRSENCDQGDALQKAQSTATVGMIVSTVSLVGLLSLAGCSLFRKKK